MSAHLLKNCSKRELCDGSRSNVRASAVRLSSTRRGPPPPARRSTQVLTWLLLPFFQYYSEAGDFTVRGRWGVGMLGWRGEQWVDEAPTRAPLGFVAKTKDAVSTFLYCAARHPSNVHVHAPFRAAARTPVASACSALNAARGVVWCGVFCFVCAGFLPLGVAGA